MRAPASFGGSWVPASALALAAATLAAPFWPALLPFVLVGAAVGTCALVLLRRPSRPLAVALAAIALWLALGLVGAWALRSRAVAGFAWVVAVLFVLPLPLIPLLYSRTFTQDPDHGSAGSEPDDGGVR